MNNSINNNIKTNNQYNKPIKKPAKKIRFVGKIILFFIIFIILSLGVFGYKVITSEDDSGSIFEQIRHLISSGDKKIKGENEDRINILLLGIGGSGHEGPYLTDTIIIGSFRPSNNKLAMLSVPRDLLVHIPNFGLRKINHAYALAESFKSGSGGKVVSKVCEEIFNIPIHYYIRVDFNGFVELIDDLGGIIVNVENDLDDEQYPIAGKEMATTSERYEHLFIGKGVQQMDGETALKFVRSRKAKGVEGSDFARSRRQQKVLLAVKDKVLSSQTLFNPKKITSLFQSLTNNLDTDLELWEIIRLYKLGKDVGSADIINQVIDDDPAGPLIAVESNGSYILVTKTGDYSHLQYIAANIFEAPLTQSVELKESDKKPEIIPKPVKISRIQIDNGTKISGLASRVSQNLLEKDYKVLKFGNAPIQNYKKTLIYDITLDGNEKTINELKSIFDAITFSSGPPSDLVNELGQPINYPLDTDADILIILGQDLKGKF